MTGFKYPSDQQLVLTYKYCQLVKEFIHVFTLFGHTCTSSIPSQLVTTPMLLRIALLYSFLHSKHNASILVPAQQWILPTTRLTELNIRPPEHKVLVREHPSQLTRDGLVHGLGYAEVGREHDVEVTLVHLSQIYQLLVKREKKRGWEN